MIDRVVQTVRAVMLAFGWRGLVRRLTYVVRLRSGWLRRRLPRSKDYDHFEPLDWDHALETPDLTSREDDIVQRAEALLKGQLRFYGWTDRQVGWPPRWHRNVFTGHEYPVVHWTEISDADPEAGDIKDVWEVSRFTWVFLLARAWARTGEDRWPEAFWGGLESWMENNPPNTGVNWRCAQEASLRAMAAQFGLAVFGSHASMTPTRRRLAGQLLEATRQRVRPTVGYALSQRNNHALSELCFLLTLDPTDRRLNRLLRECLADQFYADGSYSQQSLAYQRLAVHTLLWLDTVAEVEPRTKRSIDRALDASALFLSRIVDPVSSHAPNYGPNDGTLFLDLDSTARADFSPTLELLGSRDDSSESTAWLGRRGTPRPSRVSPTSTYITLTVDEVHVLMRCGSGRHRSAHDDQLAVDVWMHGDNVVPDPGTYRYTATDPWGNALTGAEVHARPRVEGVASRRIGRFLSAPAPAATSAPPHEFGGAIGVQAVLDTAEGRITRTVVVDRHGVSITDQVTGASARARLTHQPSGARRLAVDAADIQRLAPDEVSPTTGWYAPHYGQRIAAGATDYSVRPDTPATAVIGDPTEDRSVLLRRLSRVAIAD